MRLVTPRPTTQTERIFALEERFGKIEPMVSEMHAILVSVRTIGRFLRFVLTWFGGPSAIGAVVLYAWRAFTGH
jgi:hypothetical protein